LAALALLDERHLTRMCQVLRGEGSIIHYGIDACGEGGLKALVHQSSSSPGIGATISTCLVGLRRSLASFSSLEYVFWATAVEKKETKTAEAVEQSAPVAPIVAAAQLPQPSLLEPPVAVPDLRPSPTAEASPGIASAALLK
jgi:hypothetical protein